MLYCSHATYPVLLAVEVALGALCMDYNPATCCINIKQNASAAKTLHLKKLPFVVAVLGQIPGFLYLTVHFYFLNFNLSPSYVTDFSVRIIE